MKMKNLVAALSGAFLIGAATSVAPRVHASAFADHAVISHPMICPSQDACRARRISHCACSFPANRSAACRDRPSSSSR